MCIAILKPKGENISKQRLETCFDNNDDGAGYVFAMNGALHFFKGFFRFKDFWKSYVQNVVNNGNPISAIHFRITTHGKTNTANCHPFKVNDNLGFIHNGVIDMVDVDKKKKRSDTSVFNDTILKQLPSNFIRNTAICDLIAESIGNSKLVFLDNNENYMIIAEEQGNWIDNVWYSNNSFKWCNTYHYSTNYFTKNTPVYGKVNHQSKQKKKKKKNTPKIQGVTYSNCRFCSASLLDRVSQNLGLCQDCDYAPYSG